MARYTVAIKPSARKEMYKVPRGEAAYVTEAITALGNDPRPQGHEEVDDEPNTYKIKVRKHTVEYEISEEDNKVRILVVR